MGTMYGILAYSILVLLLVLLPCVTVSTLRQLAQPYALTVYERLGLTAVSSRRCCHHRTYHPNCPQAFTVNLLTYLRRRALFHCPPEDIHRHASATDTTSVAAASVVHWLPAWKPGTLCRDSTLVDKLISTLETDETFSGFQLDKKREAGLRQCFSPEVEDQLNPLAFGRQTVRNEIEVTPYSLSS